jgi:PBP1b-binding outer membrane lipoprotein LpoB
MKRILAIAISALLLSGCIAQWKNSNGPQHSKESTVVPLFNSPNPGPGAQSY